MTTQQLASFCDNAFRIRSEKTGKYRKGILNTLLSIFLTLFSQNKVLLASFGLDRPLFEPKAKHAKSKTKETKKRKDSPQSEQSESESPARKVLGLSSASEDGPRRSSRHAGKVVDYRKEVQVNLPRSAALASGIKTHASEGPQGQGGIRKHNPSVLSH